MITDAVEITETGKMLLIQIMGSEITDAESDAVKGRAKDKATIKNSKEAEIINYSERIICRIQ